MPEKSYILTEIRRTTEANGGVPLGTKRFSTETGIKETDWSGKYWVRWGDALKEAGYAPNEFRSAYPDDFLLERFANLARELGHFPLVREVKMKSRTDSSFPAEQAFRRLGGKTQLARKLLAFCAERPEFAQVIEFCQTSVVPAKTAEPLPRPSARVIGEVYLLKAGRHYKIGRSNSVGRREYELSIQLPQKPSLVHVIKTDDPTGIELYWHRRFEARRKNGEWFELTQEDVAAFRARKFM
jgi:hypothetical protein